MVWAKARIPPISEKFEFDDHPAIKMGYTPNPKIERNISSPIFIVKIDLNKGKHNHIDRANVSLTEGEKKNVKKFEELVLINSLE